MRIAIDAPPVRSLSANEKMVYQFLKEGLTPIEIARRMKLPVGRNNFSDNRYDVPNETITRLITSIREKGWDIPTNNKEEISMARLNEETKREIVQLALAGTMTHKDIAAKYGIGKSTVWYLVDQFKKCGETALSGETEIETKEEPAAAATETGSEQEICEDIPADIIPEKSEDVKPSYNYSPFAAKAIWNEINALREEAAALEERETQIEEIISDNKDWLRSTDEQLMFVEAQIDSLLTDYEAMTGGAAV